MMSNMEAEAIRMMKAKNGSYATVGTRKFKLQCSPPPRERICAAVL